MRIAYVVTGFLMLVLMIWLSLNELVPRNAPAGYLFIVLMFLFIPVAVFIGIRMAQQNEKQQQGKDK